MDVLSDIIGQVTPDASVSAGLDAAGEWCIAFEAPNGIKFNVVTKGTCWLRVEGEPAPIFVAEGDCFLLTRCQGFTLGTDLSLPPLSAQEVFSADQNPARVNEGGAFSLVGGRFAFRSKQAAHLFEGFPVVVHVRGDEPSAPVFRRALEQFVDEARFDRPGGRLIGERLAQIMLVEIVRSHLLSSNRPAPGWLRGLADARISRALSTIHAAPERKWTLSALSHAAGMSRSHFARRFRDVVGVPPLGYLRSWRMLLAFNGLKTTQKRVGEIAQSVGYESESAFSTAFRRVNNISPGTAQRKTGRGVFTERSDKA